MSEFKWPSKAASCFLGPFRPPPKKSRLSDHWACYNWRLWRLWGHVSPISYIFPEILAKSYVGGPYWRIGAPSYGESSIQPWLPLLHWFYFLVNSYLLNITRIFPRWNPFIAMILQFLAIRNLKVVKIDQNHNENWIGKTIEFSVSCREILIYKSNWITVISSSRPARWLQKDVKFVCRDFIKGFLQNTTLKCCSKLFSSLERSFSYYTTERILAWKYLVARPFL